MDEQVVNAGSQMAYGASSPVRGEGLAPKRQPQVFNELDQQSKLIEALQRAVSQLEERLSPVLRGELPSNEKERGDQAGGVPLAGQIMSNNLRMERVFTQLSSIRGRLEI